MSMLLKKRIIFSSARILTFLRRDYKSSKVSFSAIDKNKNHVPDEFFDDKVESEKEFMDILSSLRQGGNLENLVTVKDSISWSLIESSRKFDLRASDIHDGLDDQYAEVTGPEDEVFDTNTATGLLASAIGNPGLGDQTDEIDGLNYENSFKYMPEHMLNYNVPWRLTSEYPEEKLAAFVPDNSPEKYRYDQQGLRHCPGKRQKKGTSNVLKCHIIDLDELHSLDVLNLRRFLSDDCEILGRKLTGLCARCQRKVAKCIKRARHFGILPHLGQYVLKDSRPLHSQYYDSVKGQKNVESKSILS